MTVLLIVLTAPPAWGRTGLGVYQAPYAYSYECARGLMAPTFVICRAMPGSALIKAPRLRLGITTGRVCTPPAAGDKPVRRGGKQNSGETIYFDLDSAKLTPAARRVLDSIDRGAAVSVFGYTCPLGTAAHNRRLAEERAKAASDHLRSRGVNVIQAEGKEGCYIDCNLEKNRRAVVVRIEKNNRKTNK